MIVPVLEKRSISEPPERHRLSDSSAPSDIEELQFIEIPGSHDQTGTRKSVDFQPIDRHFAQVSIFMQVHDCEHKPTVWTTRPQKATCPYCRKTDNTRITRKPTEATWCCCWVLFFMSGLCLLSLCACCKETLHYCNHCNRLLGRRTVV